MRATTDAVGDVGTRCELRARAAPAVVVARAGVRKLDSTRRPSTSLPNQGEVTRFNLDSHALRDCVAGGAGSLKWIFRAGFVIWSRNKRALGETAPMTHVLMSIAHDPMSTCMSCLGLMIS